MRERITNTRSPKIAVVLKLKLETNDSQERAGKTPKRGQTLTQREKLQLTTPFQMCASAQKKCPHEGAQLLTELIE